MSDRRWIRKWQAPFGARFQARPFHVACAAWSIAGASSTASAWIDVGSGEAFFIFAVWNGITAIVAMIAHLEH